MERRIGRRKGERKGQVSTPELLFSHFQPCALEKLAALSQSQTQTLS